MKIYFLGSISGKKRYLENYELIIESLEDLGHKVKENTLHPTVKFVYDEIGDEAKVEYYKRVLKWISQADVVVAEVSYSSLSVGHEISLALEKGKPVVVLYCEGKAPHFLEGLESERLVIEKYSLGSLKNILKGGIEYASEQMDARFNFFISPRIASYLDSVAMKKRVPRAVYLRKLIKEDMEKQEDYQK